MGVKFSQLVEKKPLTFEDLAGKTITIDFSNFAFQFLSSIRQQDGTPLMDSHGNITSHLVGIWSRFSNLTQKHIQLAIVLDGTPPKEKLKELEGRHARKEKAQELHKKATEEEDTERMAHYAKQFSFLTPEMVDEATKLMEAMGLPVIQAPAEADAQMAYMNKHHDVWATASSDYDCLLHGAPRMITNLTLSQKRRLPSGGVIKTSPEIIELKKLLSHLNITQDQLLYLAILIGTDYNSGIHGIGPKKALKLIKEYKNPKKIFSEAKADFNWKDVYNIFVKMKVKKSYKLKWGEPNEEKIRKILVKQHDFSEERVNSTLNKLLKKHEEKEQTGLSGWS